MHKKFSMPATAMFSKFKSSAGAQSPLETNPIGQFFEIGKQIANAGPELVWRIHDAYRKSDGKVCFLLIFYVGISGFRNINPCSPFLALSLLRLEKSFILNLKI